MPDREHPNFIVALMDELPSEGSEWTMLDRVRWLNMAARIFDYIYKPTGTESALCIEVSTDYEN